MDLTTYRTLDPEGILAVLAHTPALAARLGGSPAQWTIREVSDGNLNSVFLVAGPDSGVCVKQSLPHVRVDPSWKMPLERTLYEARYMADITPAAPTLIPALLHYEPGLFLLVVESLTGYGVLRQSLIDGTAQPGFSATIGQYVARTCFHTSTLAHGFEAMSRLQERFSGNTALTRITVDLILTDPFHPHPRNRILSPELDETVTALQSDPAIAIAVGWLQERFLTAPQALLHGDLHTGSIMLKGHDIRVIDGEFALCGPIGFDAGLYVGNLLLHAFANPEAADQMHAEIRLFWQSFDAEFRTLWNTTPTQGDIHSLLTETTRPTVQNRMLATILQDLAGFAGAEIIRRTIGYAQIADYALQPTRPARAKAMRDALEHARTLILNAPRLTTIDALIPSRN